MRTTTLSLLCLLLTTAACFSPSDETSDELAGGPFSTYTPPFGQQAPADAGAALPSDSPPFPRETATGVTVTQVDCTTRGVRVDPSTMEEQKRRLLGFWVRCTTPLSPWVERTALGSEFLEVRDGSWHRLVLEQDQTLTRRSDLDGSGLVRFVDAGPMNGGTAVLQADFQDSGGGWLLTQPLFEASPDRVRFNVYAGDPIDYARVQ